MTIQVFVSYRRGDSPHAAGRLVDRLNEHFKLFLDVDRIRPGSDFTSVVREAVDKSDVLVAVIGSRWLTLTAENGGRRIDQPGDWVAEEIGTALRRGALVIPVLVDGADMPSRDELPPALADLANRQALKIAHDSFAADSRRLIETIEEMVSAATPQTVNLWDDPDYPQARGAFLQGLWPAAIEGFERVLHRHPRQQHVVEQLEQARRSQHLLELAATAESAADADRWQEVVDTLKAIDALQPSDEVKDRLTQAEFSLRIDELQNDVRALTRTGNWKAVLAADAELARLDADAADPEGLATKARAELLEAELAASYARAVKQLDNRDWAGAESTFVALLNRRAGYQDAEPLLALARRKGTPATLESQPKPAAQKPAPTDSARPREEVGRLATPTQARPPARKPEPAGSTPAHLATPIARSRPRSRSPLAIAIVAGFAVVTLITIVVGTRTVGGWPWPSGTGSIVTPTVIASNTSSPRPTPSQTSTKTTTPPPAPLKWQRETDLPEPLEAAGVTVFGDAVWVVGGNAPSAGRPKLDRVWVYKNGWQPGPELPVRLDSMPVATDGKRLFVIGGQTSDSKGRNKKDSRDVWFLDGPDDDSWQKLNPPLPDERSGGAAAWDGQRLVFAGGLNHRDLNGDGKVDDAETVNHADVWVWEGEDEWRKIGQLQSKREDLVAASDGNGRVWFLGGADEKRRVPLGDVDLVEKDRITPLADIDPVRSSSAVWIADRGVCLFGGVTKDSRANKVVCLPETASPSPTFRPLPPLTLPRAGMGAAVQGKTIWLVGGFGPERKNGPVRPGLSIVEVLVL